jgi:hypothetical protein
MQRLAVALLTLSFLATPVSAYSQQPAKRPYRVGVLESGFTVLSPVVQGLKAGLKAEGLEEGGRSSMTCSSCGASLNPFPRG